MTNYRIITIILAGFAMFIGLVLGQYLSNQPDSSGTVHVHVTGCTPNESLGFGRGAHENLGVQCENGDAYRIEAN